MTKNKDAALLAWARQNPYLTDAILMNFLRENDGACAIIPVAGDGVIEEFVDGSKLRAYDFMVQIMFQVSDTTDQVNTGNLFLMRQWQDWIHQMEEEGNYPDFGEGCGLYELENLSEMPQMVTLYEKKYEGNMAKYQFAARLKYREER